MYRTYTDLSTRLSDKTLLDRARDGDREAFEALYRRHHRSAIMLASRICGSSSAEDATQAAFISIWRSLGGYRSSRASVKTWLLAVVRNRSIDVLREQGRRPVQQTQADYEPEDPARTDALVAHQELSSDLMQAVGRLPENQRQVIELAYFADLSQAEIANRLGLPLGTVKGRTRLGLQKLPGQLSKFPGQTALGAAA